MTFAPRLYIENTSIQTFTVGGVQRRLKPQYLTCAGGVWIMHFKTPDDSREVSYPQADVVWGEEPAAETTPLPTPAPTTVYNQPRATVDYGTTPGVAFSTTTTLDHLRQRMREAGAAEHSPGPRDHYSDHMTEIAQRVATAFGLPSSAVRLTPMGEPVPQLPLSLQRRTQMRHFNIDPDLFEQTSGKKIAELSEDQFKTIIWLAEIANKREGPR